MFIFALLRTFANSLFILLQDYDILYYTIYIFGNIVGLSIHPFFFAFHLIDFVKLD